MKDAPNTINFYQQLKALQGDYKSLSEKKETFASDIATLKEDMDNEYMQILLKRKSNTEKISRQKQKNWKKLLRN